MILFLQRSVNAIINPKWLDKLVYFGIIGPIMAIPQVYLIWTGDASGVSFITWLALLFMACVWLAYALYRKIMPLIIMHTAWFIINTAVVLGLLVK